MTDQEGFYAAHFYFPLACLPPPFTWEICLQLPRPRLALYDAANMNARDDKTDAPTGRQGESGTEVRLVRRSRQATAKSGSRTPAKADDTKKTVNRV
ncbi:unnamed protein product [Protopolystoma xenopodis]|uniref:Uncharacterized protein n=1 Tax=Protopolystoma xenopodis TaxID=117903 RepID=A0A448XE64_9PLAT|nr:unnamed protein product [Protopolystoma xenopodis]